MTRLLILFVLIASCGVGAQTAGGPDRPDLRALADLAKRSYADGDFEHAARLWAEHDRAHGVSAESAFGAGNCAFRLGRLGHAIAHYRGALRRTPGQADVLHNLELCRTQLGLAAGSGTDWTGWWLGLALVGSIVAATRRRPLPRLLAAGLAVAAAIIPGDFWREQEREAVVVGPFAVVRPFPHDDAAGTRVLRTGEVIPVERVSDRWLLVGDGEGWVALDPVMLVD